MVFEEDVFLFKSLLDTISSLFPVLDLVIISKSNCRVEHSVSPTEPSHALDRVGSVDATVESALPEADVGTTTMSDMPEVVAHTMVSDVPSASAQAIPPTPTEPEGGKKSTRTSKPSVWVKDYVTQKRGNVNCCYHMSNYVSYANISPLFRTTQAAYSAIEEPKSYS